jgi:hypothetical protein
MNNVATLNMAKDTYLQLRIREDIKEDLRIVAELRGLSVSGLIHSQIVKMIREEKENSPQLFPVQERPKGIPVAPRSSSKGIPLINNKSVDNESEDTKPRRVKKR